MLPPGMPAPAQRGLASCVTAWQITRLFCKYLVSEFRCSGAFPRAGAAARTPVAASPPRGSLLGVFALLNNRRAWGNQKAACRPVRAHSSPALSRDDVARPRNLSRYHGPALGWCAQSQARQHCRLGQSRMAFIGLAGPRPRIAPWYFAPTIRTKAASHPPPQPAMAKARCAPASPRTA